LRANDIDEQFAATYQNGVLTVTLPVAARANSRRIPTSHHDLTSLHRRSRRVMPGPNSPDLSCLEIDEI
jgi:hypothetical protein